MGKPSGMRSGGTGPRSSTAASGNVTVELSSAVAAASADPTRADASWARSSWDLLTGLDVLETELGELFDQFFDSDSGAPRELVESGNLSKDQWLLAFAVELAELDRHLDPTEVIRLAKTLWQKKQDLPPAVVARDAHSTGWLLRGLRDRERARTRRSR